MGWGGNLTLAHEFSESILRARRNVVQPREYVDRVPTREEKEVEIGIQNYAYAMEQRMASIQLTLSKLREASWECELTFNKRRKHKKAIQEISTSIDQMQKLHHALAWAITRDNNRKWDQAMQREPVQIDSEKEDFELAHGYPDDDFEKQVKTHVDNLKQTMSRLLRQVL